MKPVQVNINFKQMALAFRAHVRMKALKAKSNIVYMDGGKLIEENVESSSKQVLNTFSIVQ